ncbi:MAG: hypothetical protein BJ554DRAFT_966, partial [Olpidium bornovanus]
QQQREQRHHGQGEKAAPAVPAAGQLLDEAAGRPAERRHLGALRPDDATHRRGPNHQREGLVFARRRVLHDGEGAGRGSMLPRVPGARVKDEFRVTLAHPDAVHEGVLSFKKGDFFFVLNDELSSTWWEVCNPATNVRGHVPVSYFHVLQKTAAPGNAAEVVVHAGRAPSAPAFLRLNAGAGKEAKAQPLYAIVMYDFEAERADELSAFAGDPIVVLAQSNPEWYVAKHIGKLGGPGLIPVSFVEIRDAVTGVPVPCVDAMLEQTGLKIMPVPEWKKLNAEYEAASIDLTNPAALSPLAVSAVPGATTPFAA